MTELMPFAVRAINLADHADNPVHTDAGAIAAGFPAAIVAGTTIYAYMTHVPVAAWGLEWLESGGVELRLKRPVFDGEQVNCVVRHDQSETFTDATVSGEIRASMRLIRRSPPHEQRRGVRLGNLDVTLDPDLCSYGTRCGDPLALYPDLGIAAPVLWAQLANMSFMQNLVTGPWVHTRSRIHHHGVAKLGAHLHVESTLIERFDSRAGERAIVDIVISADGTPAATVEHEAIIVLA